MLVEITFDSGRAIETLTLDVEDKEANFIVETLKTMKEFENRYYSEVVDITYREEDGGREVHTQVFPLLPFFAQGEKMLWSSTKVANKFAMENNVELLQAVTNFRALEYNFNTTLIRTLQLQSCSPSWTKSQ